MKCKLIIEDELNVVFKDVPAEVRRELSREVEYFVPGAKFTPAVKLGRWNGKTSLCSLAGRTYLNLLDRLLPIIDKHGIELEIDDQRTLRSEFTFDAIDENSYSHIKWPTGHPLADKPIVLREHQVEIVNSYLSNLQSVRTTPTAGGKTIICAIMSQKVEKYGRSIIIVPTRDLVTQTEEDYKNVGLDVGVFYGGRKEYKKTHTICTWQSLEALFKKSKKEELEIDINAFFDNVVCVIADECHRVAGAVLQKLLSGPLCYAPIRWGLTGTMPPDDLGKTILTACIGPMVGKISTTDLQEKGILASLHINILQLQDSAENSFGNYQNEHKWLTTNSTRLTYVAKRVLEMSKSGNTMVLVDRIATGKQLHLLLPDAVFISGAMKSSERKEEYKEAQEANGKIYICTYGVASTGINVNRIFNLVLFEAGKSFIKTIQSIGRGLRVAQDKDSVEVYDVCSNLKYSKRHLTERKRFYKESQYPFTVSKINYYVS
jgi:superfamily II DNA or RNA helicase